MFLELFETREARGVCFYQPNESTWVYAADDMIVFAQTFPLSKVDFAVGRVHSSYQFKSTLFQHHDPSPVRQETVSHQKISGVKYVPKPAEQADFTLSFAGVAADLQVDDRSADQRREDTDPRDRKPRPAF